ncbi:inactive dipeptidyl peptidase 10-like [Ruditapes philippinarum]|uniref:inactive dipeptidyl peptidase 10-like n=1 Tax=Ruditapes philippinarum TaxID=129788 RepID=UPI00295AF2A0|nr:inactive dipeptidyl peptidase 10-like [Ruditapes philippinarum]
MSCEASRSRKGGHSQDLQGLEAIANTYWSTGLKWNYFIYFQELVEEEKEEKNWKGIGIALLVIVVVFSCVSVAVIIVTPEEVIEREGDKLLLEELIKGDYEPYVLEPRWSRDGRHLMYKTSENELIDFECETNFSTQFLDSSPFNEFSTSQYLVSADKSYILFQYERKKVFIIFS